MEEMLVSFSSTGTRSRSLTGGFTSVVQKTEYGPTPASWAMSKEKLVLSTTFAMVQHRRAEGRQDVGGHHAHEHLLPGVHLGVVLPYTHRGGGGVGASRFGDERVQDFMGEGVGELRLGEVLEDEDGVVIGVADPVRFIEDRICLGIGGNDFVRLPGDIYEHLFLHALPRSFSS